ncbi:non-homologous end-joining DNA ligase [Tsukamurella serpentis]
MASSEHGAPIDLQVGDRTVRVTSPDRVYFPAIGATKLDVVRYYEAVGPGIVRALSGRPTMLHRFPKGVDGPKVHQKRIPAGAPDWLQTVRIHFPRFDRTADELVVTELGAVIWAAQMSTVEFHPWNCRAADLERPDEWRIDLDPMPDCSWSRVQRVAEVVRQVLDELGIRGFPKTSGGSGLHVYVRIEPRWTFAEVRRCALAFAREVERRAAGEATTVWWRKDRDPAAVFLDYNQNARDHTIAGAYSLRGTPIATASAPVTWEEIPRVHPDDFTIRTLPARFTELGDLTAEIDDRAFSLDTLVEWADRDQLPLTD